MCAWLKSYIILTFPPYPSEQFLRAIWDTVPWAILLSCPQMKCNYQLSDYAFLKSTKWRNGRKGNVHFAHIMKYGLRNSHQRLLTSQKQISRHYVPTDQVHKITWEVILLPKNQNRNLNLTQPQNLTNPIHIKWSFKTYCHF